MAGLDVFAPTAIAAGCWSDTVAFAPGLGGVPATVVAEGVQDAPVTLTGTAAAAGDPVTMTFPLAGSTFQLQLLAVCDVAGGIVLSDGRGGYFLFAREPLPVGQVLKAAAGFGHFADAPSAPACFLAGTRIATARGEVAVELLRPGDRARTLLSGDDAPVLWTGWRHLDCATTPDAAPVRVRAGAFGPGAPTRDLWLSPDHAVLADGVLVPIRHLVNGASIARSPAGHVTYWHVEIPHHDVLLADGLPAESFLDTGNRDGFDGIGAGFAPRPALRGVDAKAVWADRGCAPLVRDPAALASLRRRLHVRAVALGFTETADAALAVGSRGRVWLTQWDGARGRVGIPPGCGEVTLRSRLALPASADPEESPAGVAVRAIWLDGRPIALDDPSLDSGWYAPRDGVRWTGGAALLRLAPASRPRVLEVATVPLRRYWREPDVAALQGA